MTITNAIKKAERLSGQEVKKDDVGRYYVEHYGYIVSFIADYTNEAELFHIVKKGFDRDWGMYQQNLSRCFTAVQNIVTY